MTLNGGTISGVLAQTEQLVNFSNTIIGFGQIGTGASSGIDLKLDNQTGGIIEAVGDGQTLTIKNHQPVFNEGVLEAASGATLQINIGTINNSGNIQVYGTLAIAQPTTFGETVSLNAGGTVTLSGGMISSPVNGENLVNNGNTIGGFGQIGDGTTTNLVLKNSAGIVEAFGGALTLHTGNTVTNSGTLQALSGGTLIIDDSISNSGTLIANGGTFVLASSATIGGSVQSVSITCQ